jgi:RHS repeat-associated protein
VVTDQTATAVQSTQYYPFGMAFATSTGQNGQRFKYNDKELDLMHGLNMYDYSARHIDMGNPRFTTQDPLAEKYYSISPYAYCANNPLRYIDPTGMDWYEDEFGNVEWREEYTKDNLPKGYKYIGKTYKGLTIKQYEKTNGERVDGTGYYSRLEVRIAYTDPNSAEYENLNWVQNWERDYSEGQKVDIGKKEDDIANYPYYQPKWENRKYRNKEDSDIEYYDGPFNETAANARFSAEFSLIGDPKFSEPTAKWRNPNLRVYAPIITLKYGYSVKNGKMSITPIRVVSPSPFQKQVIKQLKNNSL